MQEPGNGKTVAVATEAVDQAGAAANPQEGMRASETRLVEILTHDYFLFIKSPDNELTYVSPTIANVLGYSPEEFLPSFAGFCRQSPNREQAEQATAISLAGRMPPSYSLKLPHKNGSWSWVEVAEIPVTDEQGRVVEIECIAHNITTLKQAEELLLEEKNKLETVFSTLGDGLTILDRNFRIVYQNELQRKRHGLQTGQPCHLIYCNRPSPCADCPLARSFADGGVHRIEKEENSREGQRHFEISAGPLRDSSGQIIGGFEIVRDVTQHKRLQAQFIQAQKMEAVGQLAGGVAHDFNNLLTGIIGFSGLVMDSLEETSPLREDLSEVLTLAKRASNLTRQLLAFSRQQILESVEVNLNGLVDNLLKMLKRLIGEDIRLEFHPGADLWPVSADIGQIEQVLANLTVNSRYAMPDGGLLRIETANRYIDELASTQHDGSVPPGPYVMLTVEDTGVGIDKETQEQIFQPFFSTKGVGEGSGLGLSTVYGIVKQHNGFIWVYSEPGHGTSFHIYLPKLQEEGVEVPAPQPATAVGRGVLLLVEDDDSVRVVIRRMLDTLGFTVLEANGPVEAIKRFQEAAGSVKLLVSDVIMPGMNGRELYDRLVAQAPGLRCLYMSGYSQETIAAKGALESGGHFIQKPFTLDDIATKINKVLESD